MGIIGGVLGALFISTNTWMSALRKKYVNTTARRCIETGMFGMMTMSVCVLTIVFIETSCVTPSDVINKKEFDGHQEFEINNFQKWICGNDAAGK